MKSYIEMVPFRIESIDEAVRMDEIAMIMANEREEREHGRKN